MSSYYIFLCCGNVNLLPQNKKYKTENPLKRWKLNSLDYKVKTDDWLWLYMCCTFIYVYNFVWAHLSRSCMYIIYGKLLQCSFSFSHLKPLHLQLLLLWIYILLTFCYKFIFLICTIRYHIFCCIHTKA